MKGTWSEVGNLEQEIFHDMIQSVEPLFSISCILCEILNCGGCFVAIISWYCENCEQIWLNSWCCIVFFSLLKFSLIFKKYKVIDNTILKIQLKKLVSVHLKLLLKRMQKVYAMCFTYQLILCVVNWYSVSQFTMQV